jgi:hypothetical protein
MRLLEHFWERLTCGHVHDWQLIPPLRLTGDQDLITRELRVVGRVDRWRCGICGLVMNKAVDYRKPNGDPIYWTSRKNDDGEVKRPVGQDSLRTRG